MGEPISASRRRAGPRIAESTTSQDPAELIAESTNPERLWISSPKARFASIG